MQNKGDKIKDPEMFDYMTQRQIPMPEAITMKDHTKINNDQIDSQNPPDRNPTKLIQLDPHYRSKYYSQHMISKYYSNIWYDNDIIEL